MMDVVTFGELLIDFVPEQKGVGLQEVASFRKAAGGAPANVAVAVSRLGGRAAFLGKVGDDAFGHHLRAVLEHEGVDASGLRLTAEARTALAFVSLKDDGERDFLFYREPSADMLIRPEELAVDILKQARIFHFGSLSLGHPVSASTTVHAATQARANGSLVSFDVNWRPPLWTSLDEAREAIRQAIPLADVLKVSEEEMMMLTDESDVARGSEALSSLGPALVFVTRGSSGAYWHTNAGFGQVPGFHVQAMDTTGAGDGFTGGVLLELARAMANEAGIPSCLRDEALIQRAVRRGNAVGALTVTKSGAIPALPTADEVDRLLDNVE